MLDAVGVVDLSKAVRRDVDFGVAVSKGFTALCDSKVALIVKRLPRRKEVKLLRV